MNKTYKRIINNSIALVILFVCLVALPWKWETKMGMTQAEYDKKMVAAEEAMLIADSPSERQTAIRQVSSLYKYRKAGRIDEIRDLSWSLAAVRFLIIVAILTLCWLIIQLVLKELRRLKRAEEKASESSATHG